MMYASDRFFPWLWHMFFDGTRLCRCWRSQWIKDHRAGLIHLRQSACGNCDWCLMPVDVLIARGELRFSTTEGEPRVEPVQ